MASNLVKVAGYVKRTLYEGGEIQYSAFNTLDQFPITDNSGSAILTNGVFNTTINDEPRTLMNINPSKFSAYYSLSDLNLTSVSQAQSILPNTDDMALNLDPTNLKSYALYGSLTERLRVALENIILYFPASLFLKTYYNNASGNNVLNYSYDNINDIATFTVPTNYIFNVFSINYLSAAGLLATYSATTSYNYVPPDNRNIAIYYADYEVSASTGTFSVVGFTGSTSFLSDYIYLQVQGNPFTAATISDISVNYHIKPNSTKTEEFFSSLDEFEGYLLNRYSKPLYTSVFTYNQITDDGVLLKQNKIFTWPLSDSWNIDFNSILYTNYASDLKEMTDYWDNIESDIIVRYLVADAITDFDSINQSIDTVQESASGKMMSLLRIYGRELDEINRYIMALQFSNVVTYSKQDNCPDQVVLSLADSYGFDLTGSIQDNDIISSYLTRPDPLYSGHSIGQTVAEQEIEFWRRLIINQGYLFKSKGTRGAIEFLMRAIGCPPSLFALNEYVYVAKRPLDINIIKAVLYQLSGTTDTSELWVDSDGYPYAQPNNFTSYYQNNGLWYKENNIGNNIHQGSYDYGQSYINNFKNLFSNFSPTTITDTVTTSGYTNIFTNYNSGSFDYLTDTTVYVDLLDGNNLPTTCVDVDAFITTRPFANDEYTECGCLAATDNKCMQINVTCNPYTEEAPCQIDHFIFGDDGYIVFFIAGNISSKYLDEYAGLNDSCCTAIGFEPININESEHSIRRVCRWYTPPESPLVTSTITNSGTTGSIGITLG